MKAPEFKRNRGAHRTGVSPLKSKGIGESTKKGNKLTEAEEKVLRAKEREERSRKLREETSTTIKFIDINGARSEIVVERLFKTYYELQLELSRLKQNSTNLFMILKPNEVDVVRPENYEQAQKYTIRVLPSKKMASMKFTPRVDTRWEFESYEGAPKGWLQEMNRKVRLREKKRSGELAAASTEEEKKKLMEELEGREGNEDDSSVWGNTSKKN